MPKMCRHSGGCGGGVCVWGGGGVWLVGGEGPNFSFIISVSGNVSNLQWKKGFTRKKKTRFYDYNLD